MAINVMSWAWRESRAEGAALLVLLAIADQSHEDGGGAWPSVATLAVKARVSERTVQRCIRELVSMGELEVQRNAGHHGVNVYRVIMSGATVSHPDITTPRHAVRATSNAEGVTTAAPRGDMGVTRTIQEPSKNHPERTPETRLKLPRSTDDPQFSEFWRTYPKRVGKVDAFKKFVGALKSGTDPAVVLAGAQRYAAKCRREGTEERFIANPATWLNQGRWDDEPVTAVQSQPKQVSGGW